VVGEGKRFIDSCPRGHTGRYQNMPDHKLPPKPTGRLRIIEKDEKSFQPDLEDMPACYVVYEKPMDYPNEYVIRKWVWSPNDRMYCPMREIVARSHSLRLLRLAIPTNCVRVVGNKKREASVIETWIEGV
jgi:hypothetical protein